LELFHCPAKKVVFTPSATEAINVILQGLPITDNYNIYISPFEHNAVTRVINYLQGLYKLNIITLSVNENNLTYDLEKIRYQFTENKPNIVIISLASNVCGVIAPITEICTMSHQYGSINVIDMCQTAGLIDTDLSSNMYDFVFLLAIRPYMPPLALQGLYAMEILSLSLLFMAVLGLILLIQMCLTQFQKDTRLAVKT
jgi:selenocysteine lyase/cysteine desulfurase